MTVPIHTFHFTNTKMETQITKNVLINQAVQKGTWNVIWTVSQSHFYSWPSLYSLVHTKSTWKFPLFTIYHFTIYIFPPLYYLPYGKPVDLTKFLKVEYLKQTSIIIWKSAPSDLQDKRRAQVLQKEGERRRKKKTHHFFKPSSECYSTLRKDKACFMD